MIEKDMMMMDKPAVAEEKMDMMEMMENQSFTMEKRWQARFFSRMSSKHVKNGEKYIQSM